MSSTYEASVSSAKPSLTLLELPAAAAQERSKYLAQGFLLFVGLVFLVGTFLILRWSSQALEQQAVLWETRLSQAAYSDAAHVTSQFDTRLAPWQRLASSNAMKLYIMQALDPQYRDRDSARMYVENALRLAAQRDGIDAQGNAALAAPVNDPAAMEGLYGPGVVLVAADQSPQLRVGAARVMGSSVALTAKKPDGIRVYGPYTTADAQSILLSFVVPVTQVQSELVVAELHITYALDERFLPPRAEPHLDPDASRFAMVSSLSDQILGVAMTDGQPRIDLRYAPSFGGDGRYRWAATVAQNGSASARSSDGASYLVSAQAVPGTTWVALRFVSEDHALALVKRQTWIWLLLSFLALGVACGLILYSWRRGVDHRAAAIAAARDTANRALADANSFLNTVADTQPSALLVLDLQGQIVFANAAAGHLVEHESGESLLGHALADVFEQTSARALERAAQTARATGQLVSASLTIRSDGALRNGRITAALLAENADDGRVVLSFDDLTDIIALRAKRESALRQLVTVLTDLIDARDPHSAAHSRSVAALARKVGRSLNYADDALRDLEMSALLSNAGKILVPRSVLTKPGSLTSAELQTVRDAVARTSSLLDEVDFDGRVASILNAMDQERDADPSDRQAATIITVSNALVGMLSPRSYREALSLDDAMERLSALSADRQTLAALEHVARNHWTPTLP